MHRACPSVRLFVCLSVAKIQKRDLELWCLIYWRSIGSRTSAFPRTRYYLAIQRSVWRDIKFAVFFVFVFVCLYGWGYLNAGWCDRREILAQGRAYTRDGNEVVRGWSAHGGPWGGGWIFTLRSVGKYCVIHISETRGAIDTKFAGYIHPVLPEVFSALGVARSRRVPAAGFEHFLGWGYSFSWIGQLPFVFAWASLNVVQYLGDRLAHVLMKNFSNRPRGFYTVAQKIRKFILFWQFMEFTSLYLRNDKEYRHIRSTINKGGYLPCAAVPFILAYLSSAVYRLDQSITGTIL